MSRAHEEQVAEITAEYSDSQRRSAQKLKKNIYYQRLQENIKRKKTVVKSPNLQKGLSSHTQSFNPKKILKPKFKWAKNKKGDLYISPRPKAVKMAMNKIEKGASHIVKFLGYKIDLSSQVDSLMEKYQKYYIEMKSHNVLLAKFAQLKAGMLMRMLTLLGVPPKMIREAQRTSLEAALTENKMLFAQNEYNVELMTIFNMGKDMGRLIVLQELAKQLIKQMEKLGGKGYYSKQKILEIKKEQVQKIAQDLIEEKQNLEFLAEYRG